MTERSSRSLPPWRSLDELVDYFDTHDMGEHLDKMPNVDLEVDIKRRRHLVAIDDDVLAQVSEVADKKGLSTGGLINIWLRERIRQSRR